MPTGKLRGDSWAAQYNTWLLIKLTPKDAVFSFWMEAYQQSQGGNLKQQPQLGLCGGRCHIGEHTLLLYNDLQPATLRFSMT